MLNPFPGLLIYSIVAPALLRIAVAVCFIIIANHLIRHSKKIKDILLPVIGRVREWMVYISALVTILVAFFLFVGLWVQWAALLGLGIALKHAFIPKRLREFSPFSRSTMILLAVICVSLLFLGAGAYAFDIRL